MIGLLRRPRPPTPESVAFVGDVTNPGDAPVTVLAGPVPELPLDEATLRRPDFIDGDRQVRIELANGQKWAFPRPVIELRMEFGPGDAIGFSGKPMYGDGGVRSFGQGYLDLLDRINEAKGDYGYLCAMAGVVATLLRQNYTLSNDHLVSLLPWVVGADERNEDMWRAIKGVITGEAPKPDPAIGDSPSSPGAG